MDYKRLWYALKEELLKPVSEEEDKYGLLAERNKGIVLKMAQLEIQDSKLELWVGGNE